MNFAETSSAVPAAPALPGTLRLGAVHLTVTDLDRSVAFYEDAIGLRPHRRDGDTAALGAGGGDLIVLTERPGARLAGRHAGLYHYALLFDSREELAHAVLRLIATRTPSGRLRRNPASESGSTRGRSTSSRCSPPPRATHRVLTPEPG
jgi:catechol-2,3-dioxygenase